LKGLPVARAADSRPARVMQAVPCVNTRAMQDSKPWSASY
jgi:hypothetical protein